MLQSILGVQHFYSALSIPPKVNGKLLPQLGSNKRDELRHRFSELQAVIIDEVSMVNQNSLEHINQRLNEIFGTAHDVFGGLMVILVGDLLQLPPVRGSRVFQLNQFNPLLNIDMLWHYFQMIELTEVVIQKDPVFIKLLKTVELEN